ncbi:MAG: bifunctional 3-(3-hydroxy-phenyl)propionate/3-hydroxycinnamic acid hydroxylase [Blastocatellia bacterium]
MEIHNSDVAIIGCGPTGVVLATLLGQLGCKAVVIEREAEIYPIPRAAHIDEETQRNFQATGLMHKLSEHMAPFGLIDFVDEKGRVLVEDKVRIARNPHGYTGSCYFDQPAFDRILRDGLSRYPQVILHTGVEAERIADNGGGVTVYARRLADDVPLVFNAAWLVGCDGGQSLTRGVLELEMESFAPKRRWLVVDTLLKDVADAALLPNRFRYVLNPQRLTIFANGIGRNRRWEFQLGDDEEMPDEAEVLRWVSAFIDPQRLDVTRIVTYSHNALVAKTWRVGRVFVAGDAAHMMPPSAGQGMCSGVRDAINLAWKLAAVISGRAKIELLDSYGQERRPHSIQILKGTLFLSERLQANNAFQRWRRRLQIRILKAAPPLQAIFHRLTLRRPRLQPGFINKTSRLAGQHLPQVKIEWRGGETLLDDVFGYCFALLLKPEMLSASVADWAAKRNIGVWRLGDDFKELQGELAQWMREETLDFVLVRPDRYVFGAGAMSEFAQTQSSFDGWWN